MESLPLDKIAEIAPLTLVLVFIIWQLVKVNFISPAKSDYSGVIAELQEHVELLETNHLEHLKQDVHLLSRDITQIRERIARIETKVGL